MQENSSLQVPIQTGFHSVLQRRAAMQQWSVVSRLFRLGDNREATNIVNSFQVQMDFEASVNLPTSDKAA
jgi:hypothetical protein